MSVRLIYQMFTKLLCWMVLYTHSDTANEIEILVLRHQLAVLQRGTSRPRINTHLFLSRSAAESDGGRSSVA